MTTRAKFKVAEVRALEGGVRIVKALPVVSGSDENRSFSKYTPSGALELTVTQAGAMSDFAPGVEFYVDMTPCATAEAPK